MTKVSKITMANRLAFDVAVHELGQWQVRDDKFVADAAALTIETKDANVVDVITETFASYPENYSIEQGEQCKSK